MSTRDTPEAALAAALTITQHHGDGSNRAAAMVEALSPKWRLVLADDLDDLKDREAHWHKLATVPDEDDPQWDGTDGAHPAWWRGDDHGYARGLRAAVPVNAERLALPLHDLLDGLGACGANGQHRAWNRIAEMAAALIAAAPAPSEP